MVYGQERIDSTRKRVALYRCALDGGFSHQCFVDGVRLGIGNRPFENTFLSRTEPAIFAASTHPFPRWLPPLFAFLSLSVREPVAGSLPRRRDPGCANESSCARSSANR